MNVPHDANAEQALLGAIIIEPDILPTVLDYIHDPAQFYIQKNAMVFKAMLELFNASKPLDLVEISAITKDLPYLLELSNSTPTAANAENYARIVKEKAIRRELLRACAKGVELAKDESKRDLDAVIGEVEAGIFHATKQNFQGKIHSMKDLAKNRWEDCFGDKDKPAPGVKTGFYDLDALITCLKNGELTIIAGRTSMGKTTLALDIARSVATAGNPVMIFSLEMRAERIADRIICAQGMIPGQLFRSGQYGDQVHVSRTIAEVYELPLYVYDKRVTTTEIRAKAMQVKDLKLVVVDFLTLIKDKRQGNVSTADHVGEIAKRLQETAKELNVPFVVLSQMNRGIETREKKRPKLSDLRDSGNIEEAADNVIFVHRPSYYDENEPKDVAILYIDKQRDGPTGAVKLLYYDMIPTFRNLSKYKYDDGA
jgi:replicative DNA helicase